MDPPCAGLFETTGPVRVGTARQVPANGKLLPDEEASRLAVLFRIRCHKEGASPLWRTTEGDVLYEKTGYQIHHRSGTAGGGGNRALPLLLHQRLGSEDRLQLPASGGRSHAARTAGGRRSGRRERLRRGGAVSHRGVFPRLHPDGLSLRPRVRVAATPPPNGGPRSGCGPAPPAGAGPAHQLVLDLRPVQRTLCPAAGDPGPAVRGPRAGGVPDNRHPG